MPPPNRRPFGAGSVADWGIFVFRIRQKSTPVGVLFLYLLFLMFIRQHSVGALYAVHGGGHNATGVTGALTTGVHPA